MTTVNNSQKEPSINDSLPNGNPSMRTVLLVLVGLVAAAAVIVLLVELNS